MITAPFNFVPLNKEVFYPSWDKDVSHDIPFEDGESGMVDIEISAETAIYIRNHYALGDDFYVDNKKNKVSTEFCHMKDDSGGKQYYIPSSSVKGMIRNIIEIMSFSKINVDEKTLKKPLSVRDMTQDKKTGDIFNHDMVATAKKCGFLVKEGDNYFIEDCGNVLTIKDSEIRMKIHDYSKNIDTAKEKYNKFGYIDFPFSTAVKGERKTTVAVYNKNSKNHAKLVMTGFIDNKKNEFIFQKNGIKKSLEESVFENFEKVYFLNEDAIDGQYWKKEWNSGKGEKIPIFYTEKNRKIVNIGLTQIFKLAYTKTLFDAINQKVDKNRLDLAETMFGTEREEHSLKGRVQFSHMKSTHITYEKEKSEILGSPQATYYPNYLRQTNLNGDKVNKYMTLMDNGAEISGYKRYPLHHGIKASFIPKEEKTDIQTKFKPLNKGTVFKGKLRFHNLKKAEIGALLSALTFHGHNDYRHNLGMAKSLGFGKVKIDITLNNLKYKQEDYLKEYEKEMTIFTDKWIESPQILELFSMASNKIISDKSLEYQKLENPNTRDREKNDFTRAKKTKEYLKNYSQIGNVEKVHIESLIDTEEVEIEKEERAKLEIEKEEKQNFEILLKSNNLDILQNFINKYPNHEKIVEVKSKLNDLKSKNEEHKHEEAEGKFKNAYEALQRKKGNQKQYNKELNKFIKKWGAEKNNKKSPYIIEEIKKLK